MLRDSHFFLVRDALVYRYLELSKRLQSYGEIKDVLDVIREDVRTCEEFSYEANTKFPEWCAIVDYFEGQQQQEWIVWLGSVETQLGTLPNVCLKTPNWTAGALQYWYNDFELFQFSLVPPMRSPPLPLSPFGILEALTDVEVMERLQYTLNHEYENIGRYSLVPRHMDFDSDPSICFTLPADNGPSLNCYWDEQDGYDWEEAIDRLGENVIRIMSRYCVDGRSFSRPYGMSRSGEEHASE